MRHPRLDRHLRTAATEEAFDRMMLGAEVMAKVLLRVLEDAEFADSLRRELKA